MAKIKIKDLPKDQKISKSELKNIKGGLLLRRANLGRMSSQTLWNFTKLNSTQSMDIDCW